MFNVETVTITCGGKGLRYTIIKIVHLVCTAIHMSVPSGDIALQEKNPFIIPFWDSGYHSYEIRKLMNSAFLLLLFILNGVKR